ncbi:MAG: adenosylmethionine decarboxylase [Gammaproteobacteria bacterium]|nr:adenosylmethionine decarboxylase [Gammaproteobacteria bacterium]
MPCNKQASLPSQPVQPATNPRRWPVYSDCEINPPRKDHFVERDGMRVAGMHLLADFWDAQHLGELDYVEQALRRAVIAARATLLHIHLHHFTPNGGVSGVAVLAESHISVHTWPEISFAAFDVFMCGDAVPERAIDVLCEAFLPQRMELKEQPRGVIKDGSVY